MNDAQVIYKELKIKSGRDRYTEEVHCPLLFETIAISGRLSEFCVIAKIGKRTLFNWINNYPLFGECYHLAIEMAHEGWIQEYKDHKADKDFDIYDWKARGKNLDKNPIKMLLDIDSNSTPWEQYKQVINQASKGDLNAQDVKLLMEAVSAGTKVFETFKMQQEVDKMREDLNQMSQRNGRATTSTNLKIAASNPNPV